jgi:phage virion morphogenesis protein
MASQSIPIGYLDARLGEIIRDIQPNKLQLPLKVISGMILSDVRNNFARSQGPDGRKWKPLAHGRPGQSGGLPLRDTGMLLASTNSRVVGQEIIVGSNHISAGVHQFGGTIKPKKAKLLAIPLTKEAKRAGSPRNFPRPLVAIIGKSGEGVLIEAPPRRGGSAKGKKPAAKGKGKAQFALVKQVIIPARPFLGFSAPLMDRIERLLIDTVLKQVAGS